MTDTIPFTNCLGEQMAHMPKTLLMRREIKLLSGSRHPLYLARRGKMPVREAYRINVVIPLAEGWPATQFGMALLILRTQG
ncbi:MAG: hypothetical protein IT487_12845 [Chromatiaceae bacterium]|nr:hypothetical protein [Chromatiaceae bacterium]